MVLATLAVLVGTASMVGALLSQAAGWDAEPYLPGGVLGLAGGYAVATLGGRAVNSGETRVRLLRNWRLRPSAVRVLVGLTALGALASAAAMLLAFTAPSARCGPPASPRRSSTRPWPRPVGPTPWLPQRQGTEGPRLRSP